MLVLVCDLSTKGKDKKKKEGTGAFLLVLVASSLHALRVYMYILTLAACLIFPSFCNSIEVANKSSQSPDVPFYKR